MMRKSKMALSIITVGLAVIVHFNACNKNVKFEGTGPVLQNTVAGNPLVTYKLSAQICQAVQRCHPEADMSQCEAAVLASSGFSAPLKVPTGLKTLADILQAESNGTLRANASFAENCFQSFKSLQCSDPQMESAYQSSSASPFAGAANIVSGNSCGQILTPVIQYACSSKVFLRGETNPSLKLKTPASGLVFSITPPLPSGLDLDVATGTISGTPAVTSGPVEYTVTARGGAAPVSQKIQLQMSEGYLVTDTSDSDNTAGTVCRTANGTCSLRAAIAAANLSSASKVILLPADTFYLKTGKSLKITKPMEIYGDCESGSILDGVNATRVLEISSGPVRLESLTVQNGSVTNSAGAGVLISASAAPFNVIMKSLIIRNNRNTGGTSGMSNGTGVAVFGQPGAVASLRMDNCTVSDNTNTNGNFGAGVGLWYNTQATISNTKFSGNRNGGSGGALSSHSGDLKVSQSLFTNNTCDGEGGAIFIDHYSSLNSAITNVTFDSNSAAMGGAIYLGANSMTILNSTFSQNRSTSPYHGGALAGSPTQFLVSNTIFTKNFSGGVLAHCKGSGALPVSSLGFNLSDSDGSDCRLLMASDLVLRSPMLGTLQDNGGSTASLALLPGSPAIGAGDSSACPSADQRGAARLTSGSCDIGAFEVQR